MTTQDVPYSRLKEICTQCGKSYAEGTGFCPVDGAELMSTMADPLIGMVLPRRYRIMSLLGRGSMSVVYKGTYEPLDQLVAIKMLKSHLVSDPHQAKRFQQEIKTAGSLSHPNIVGILDFGVTEQGVPYLIMEYLEGKSLAEILEKEERISVNRVIRIFSQASDALAHAHREGVVHRDIKPSNIIIVDTEEETDVVKIVDFGIAKIQRSGTDAADKQHAQGLTGTGEVVGTPLYMSPEQSQGKDLDGRSDIYSLGCVMYHGLTGKPPFVGDTTLDTIRMQITATPTPIDVVRPDLFFPDRMQSIVTKSLAKDPRMRYQRMEHLQADIDSCQQRPTAVSSANVRAIQRETPQVQQPSNRFEMPQLSLPVIAVGVGVLIAASVGIWAVATDVGKKDANLKVDLPMASDAAWRTAVTHGETAMMEGRFDEAEKALQEALHQAKKFKQPDARTAKASNDLSQLYYSLDKLQQAEAASKEALTISRGLGPYEPTTADALANLSRIQCANGRYDEAAATGKEALAIRQKKLGPSHQDVAASLAGLAEIECKRGNFPKAADMLTRAQAMAEKALGPDNPEVASILHNLGMVRERQGNYAQASALFNRALGIRQRYLGTTHPSVSDTMCALGTLNFNMRKDSAAEAMFNNALDIRMQVFGEKSSKTAEIYSCLAILYDNERRYQQAEECYRKAVEIRESLWGPNSPRLERSLMNLAKFLRDHGQKNGAEVYEVQLKRIREHRT